MFCGREPDILITFYDTLGFFPCGTEYKYKHYQAAFCNLTVVPLALLHRFKPTHQQESFTRPSDYQSVRSSLADYSAGFKLHFCLAQYHNPTHPEVTHPAPQQKARFLV